MKIKLDKIRLKQSSSGANELFSVTQEKVTPKLKKRNLKIEKFQCLNCMHPRPLSTNKEKWF